MCKSDPITELFRPCPVGISFSASPSVIPSDFSRIPCLDPRGVIVRYVTWRSSRTAKLPIASFGAALAFCIACFLAHGALGNSLRTLSLMLGKRGEFAAAAFLGTAQSLDLATGSPRHVR
jgi:hypothetical protein